MAQTKIKLIADGVIDENNLKAGHTITTDNIGEGTNLYYTDARVGSYLSTNSYATEGYVTTAVANLVDAAPSTLDTLNELAAALGDDPNFATTVTNSIATKLPLAGGTLTGNLIVNANVGIGNTDPNSTLEVTAGSNAVSLALRARASADDYSQINFYNNAGTNLNGIIGVERESTDGGNMYFWTKPDSGSIAERMRITSSGNIGIGVSNPTAALFIAGPDGQPSLKIDSGHSNGYLAEFKNSYGTNAHGLLINAGNDSSDYPLRVQNTAGTVDGLVVNGSGNVGIGTSSPSANLHIKSNGDATLLIEADSDNVNEDDNPALILSQDGGLVTGRLELTLGNDLFLNNTYSGSSLVFGTANTERMRISSNGNVGINNTNPYAKLTTTGLAIPNAAGGTPNEVGLPEFFETRSYYFNCTTSFATFLTHSSNNYTYLIVYRIGAADLTSVPNGMIMAFRNSGLGVSYIAGSSSYIQVSGYDLQIRSNWGSYGTVVQMQITRIG